MRQTPAHDQYNPDLLRLIPNQAARLIEVGCSSGALARAYKKVNADCHYFGVEIDPSYARLAETYCDAVQVMDVEEADLAFFRDKSACECWIFGDTLEHLKDPWSVLERIRAVIPANGSVVACIPNAQHWSVQQRLCSGMFRYEGSGLLDRTHLRWFTRQTITELFRSSGFSIVEGLARVFEEPNQHDFLPGIRAMAACIGCDPDIAVNDALPLQYVVRAVPG